MTRQNEKPDEFKNLFFVLQIQTKSQKPKVKRIVKEAGLRLQAREILLNENIN